MPAALRYDRRLSEGPGQFERALRRVTARGGEVVLIEGPAQPDPAVPREATRAGTFETTDAYCLVAAGRSQSNWAR